MPFVPCDDCQTKAECTNNHEYGRPIQCRQANGGQPLPIDRPAAIAMPSGACEDDTVQSVQEQCPDTIEQRMQALCDRVSQDLADFYRVRAELLMPRVELMRAEIAKLELIDGDILTITVQNGSSFEHREYLSKQVSQIVPKGTHVMVMEQSTTLAVVHGCAGKGSELVQ